VGDVQIPKVPTTLAQSRARNRNQRLDQCQTILGTTSPSLYLLANLYDRLSP
jgi:hypothetical protein